MAEEVGLDGDLVEFFSRLTEFVNMLNADAPTVMSGSLEGGVVMGPALHAQLGLLACDAGTLMRRVSHRASMPLCAAVEFPLKGDVPSDYTPPDDPEAA